MFLKSGEGIVDTTSSVLRTSGVNKRTFFSVIDCIKAVCDVARTRAGAVVGAFLCFDFGLVE